MLPPLPVHRLPYASCLHFNHHLRIFARDSELRTLPGFSLNPYRVSHFRFHGLKEHKVLARTEAHVPWYSVAVPCALVDLLIKERMPALSGDRLLY